MTAHLLPPSATEQERDISLVAGARIESVEVPLRDLWDPQTCPVDLLPWLAWTFSVDRWKSAWTEQQKRDTIAASIAVHRYKGSVASVRKAVEALGTVLVLREWFEYGGDPYTARIEAYTMDVAEDGTGINPEIIEDLLNIIEYTAPVRVHFDLEAGALMQGAIGMAAIASTPAVVASMHWRGSTEDVALSIDGFIGAAAILLRPILISSIHLRT